MRSGFAALSLAVWSHPRLVPCGSAPGKGPFGKESQGAEFEHGKGVEPCGEALAGGESLLDVMRCGDPAELRARLVRAFESVVARRKNLPMSDARKKRGTGEGPPKFMLRQLVVPKPSP